MSQIHPIINPIDLNFLLYDWLQLETLTERPRFNEHSREVFDAVLEMALSIATDKFATHAAKLDQNEPHFDGERVHIIPVVKAALDAFSEAGFISASFSEAHGGMGLPYTISQAAMAMFSSASTATAAYPLLTAGAAHLLEAYGTDAQKERYMLPMLEGRFFGTMCLSEPQAGSALSGIRTTAYPQEDGSYRLVGDKMWISGAEHDMSETIVHLVLARLPDAPKGTRGISLFIVPKHTLDEDGAPGDRNDVAISGLNHKMGYRGTVNTVLHFGSNGGARGEIVGQPNRGLEYMFHMMNEARIGVGLGAAMLGYAGYLYSRDYARERRQGKLPWKRDGEPVAIIEHPDIRRMLLTQKVFAEGALALCLYCAYLVDDMASTDDPQQKAELDLILQLLTPIAKSWPAEFCLEANKQAIQVLGGYGYSTEYPVERYYRDNRLNPIHEGTHGIQALDLLGRKVRIQDGAALRLLAGRIQDAITACAEVPELAELVEGMQAALTRASETTLALLGAGMKGDVPRYLANASVYLDMMGHTVVGWMWLEQANVALHTGAEEGEGGLTGPRQGGLHPLDQL
ncbi:MAG: acyl-CoA dehydrogenase, partial [Myxococcota bacterium]